MGFSRSFRALCRRNLIYRKRRWISSLFEFILPVAFVGILVGIKSAVENTDAFKPRVVPATYPASADVLKGYSFHDYLTSLSAEKRCMAGWGPTGYLITGIDPYNNPVPFMRCDSRRCESVGEDAVPYCEFNILALAPSDEDDALAEQRVDDFMTFLGETYPQLLDASNFPFDHKLIQKFPSQSVLEQYVRHPDYGVTEDMPKVAVAVVFDSTEGTANDYSYSIRVNSTGYNSPENEGRPASPTTPSTAKLFESFAKTPEEACPLQGGAPSPGYYGYTCVGQYLYNGALSIQRLVNDYILDATGAADSGAYVAENGVSFVYFPEPEYTEEGFYATIAQFVPLLIVLGLLYPVAACIRSIVQEKELRQKELMKMMSVPESAIGWSWFVMLYGFLLLSAILTSVVSSALYSNSNFVILLVFWAFTFLGSLMFATVIAAIFSKATRATLVGILLYFGGYFLTLALDYTTDSPGALFAVSLHPVTAFSYALQVLGDLEDKGVGLTPSTISFSDSPSGYSFGNAMASLIFDCLLWGILSWYLNRVVRGDYGTPLPWYFLFSKSYWLPSRIQFDDEDEENINDKNLNIPCEPVSEALLNQEDRIQIRNLSKSFGDKQAVDGLNLDMYSGQVTALLGHNGAGKTTTISMLTGMLSPTSGYAKVAGYDVRSQMALVREKIGICLQHDCLFPLLTVREHIEFFGRLKGIYDSLSKKEADASVQTSIEDVALLDKRNTLSKDLSGGMKRKLSVAIAFCGNSNTVILDEPSSGMDPFSRRFVWNLIRQYRESRCIVLTTHFMDEAEVLGDRIAIMAEGSLRCVGSSLFLKKKYGVGYNLTVEKQQPAARSTANGTASRSKSARSSSGNFQRQHEGAFVDEDDVDPTSRPERSLVTRQGSQRHRSNATTPIEAAIIGIVQGAVSEASLLTNVGNEISFQLPLDSSSEFPNMLNRLDDMVEGKEISSYGVGITTLEEVFLMVARGETGEKDEMQSVRRGKSIRKNGSVRSSTRGSFRSTGEEMQEQHQFARHCQALFAKRAMNFKRDKKAWCCSTICPSIFALIGFLVVAYAPSNGNMPPVLVTLENNNPQIKTDLRNPIPFNEAGGEFSCQPGTCIGYTDSSLSGTGENLYFCGESAVFGDDGDLSTCSDEGYCGPNCTISESDFYMNGFLSTDEGNFLVPQNVSGVEETSYSLGNTSTAFTASQYAAIYFMHDAQSVTTFESGVTVTYSDASMAACVEREQSDEVCERFTGLGYLVSSNFTSLHASIQYQAATDAAIARSATENEAITINPTLHPLPITSVEESYISGEDAFTAWFLLVVSFPFISGAFGTFVVSERLAKAKHLQTVAGVKPWAYWLSTYAWDTLNYQLPLWIIIGLMYAVGLEAFTTSDRDVAAGTIITMFLFGPAAAGFTYCTSFMFKSPSMCNLFSIIFGFIIGMVPAIVSFILRLIAADPNGELAHFLTIAQAIEWIFRFFPPFCFAKGLFFLINIESISLIYAKPDITAFDSDILLYEVIFLAVECVAYIALAVFIDKMSNRPSAVRAWKSFVRMLTCRCCCSRVRTSPEASTVTDSSTIDEDVAIENERVASGAADDSLIVVNDLTKVYDNGKRAVDHLSLGVPAGECFGLLGINGAGKTTTMSVLTAEFPPTTGDALLDRYSVTFQPEKTRQRIGYCPQFDAHFTNMTGREHIELYAAIKGLPKSAIKGAVASKLAEVGLSEYDGNRLSSQYSGGMKRKLSVAIATIGSPPIVFLDEPSTGMDPVARRDLWRVISDMVSGQNGGSRTSVILTTHSMEECEALCPRIGIMAQGKLRCLGSAQRLKSRFGRGFQVEAKVLDVLRDDGDYQDTLFALLEYLGESPETTTGEDVFISLDDTLAAVNAATGGEESSGISSTIAATIAEDNPIGYNIYKDASSETGIAVDEVAQFCTEEMRVENLQAFFEGKYSTAILRERQESKVRYEVASNGLKISSIFEAIEANKETLQLADYGVSQTSLEQIFNFFAAEAEERKQGQDDR